MSNRRDFFKVFGISSAVAIGAAGAPEVMHADTTNPPPKPVAGNAFDQAQWERANGAPHMCVVSGVLYDRLDIPKNGLGMRHTFFDRGWANGRGPEETNVTSACRLDAPEMFKVDKFGVTFLPGIRPELRDAIIRRYSLSFWLGPKRYFQAPLVEAFGGPNSDPTIDFKTLYHVDMPIVIGSDHQFHAEIESANPLPIHPKLTMWGVFHGQYARGVQ